MEHFVKLTPSRFANILHWVPSTNASTFLCQLSGNGQETNVVAQEIMRFVAHLASLRLDCLGLLARGLLQSCKIGTLENCRNKIFTTNEPTSKVRTLKD